jgi:signal transduction histidine kinase
MDTNKEDLVIRVSDQGSGILIEDQAQLFEPFFRHENKHESPGLGLGLTIVRDAIDLQGGSIDIDSQPGRGTTFIVRIPQPVLV